jgi:hypothetical protein
MRIVAADAMAQALSEAEVLALLAEPILMHLALVDGQGWPVVNPVWHVFEDGVFRLVVGRDSHKARLLRALPRAYYAVDEGGVRGDARGVRGRAAVRVRDGEPALATEIARKVLLKYTGTDQDEYAREQLQAAQAGGLAVVELTPSLVRAFRY